MSKRSKRRTALVMVPSPPYRALGVARPSDTISSSRGNLVSTSGAVKAFQHHKSELQIIDPTSQGRTLFTTLARSRDVLWPVLKESAWRDF